MLGSNDMTKAPDEIPLRIVVAQPPPGVTFAVQRGKSDLTPPTAATDQSIVFDLTIRIAARQAKEPPNLLGPYAQDGLVRGSSTSTRGPTRDKRTHAGRDARR